jgi:hypothetical protein
MLLRHSADWHALKLWNVLQLLPLFAAASTSWVLH